MGQCDEFSAVSGVVFNQDAIKEYIETNLSYRIGEGAETATITEVAQKAIESVGGQGYAVDVLISTNRKTWVEYLPPVIATRFSVAGITITEI